MAARPGNAKSSFWEPSTEARRDTMLNLAWLTFGFATLQTYLLAEAGPRFNDGNFAWSSQISLFVLFTVSHNNSCHFGALRRDHELM